MNHSSFLAPPSEYDNTTVMKHFLRYIILVILTLTVSVSEAAVDMVLFPGGYATINGTAVTFHYYTQDYLGNNRAVINGSTGAVEQTVAYYPYGGIIADLGKPYGGQPYRFGGKELITVLESSKK